MICGNCGNSTVKGSDYCPSCGTKLNLVNDSSFNKQTQTSDSQYEHRGKLYRSRDDRWVGGVAGGIGEHYDVDPNIVRLIWIILIFAWGTGIVAYIVGWLIIPENPVIRPRSY